MMQHGAALRHKVALAGRVLEGRVSEVSSASDIDALLPELLFRTHCVARASAPLMRAARARALELNDPVARGIREYLTDHIEEEQAHADWVLDDLEGIGCSAMRILARVPPSSIAELVGAQYYWIHHAHPVALLSYIAVLEEHVTPASVVRELIASSSHAPAAFRTLLEHAELDPSHVAELYALIDRLPLSTEQVTLLSVNAFRTVELLDRSFDEISEIEATTGALAAG
jgi:hypothetical protein